MNTHSIVRYVKSGKKAGEKEGIFYVDPDKVTIDISQ